MGKNEQIMNKDLSFEEFEDYARNVPRRDYKTVFCLVEIDVTTDREEREVMYPEFEIRQRMQGIFSDKAHAEEGIKECVKSAYEDNVEIYCFKVYEVPLDQNTYLGTDNFYRSVREYLYNDKSHEIDSTTCSSLDEDIFTEYGSFLGKPKEHMRFKKGDIVEVIEQDKVRLAVVTHDPADTNWCYDLYKRLKKKDDLPYFLDESDYQVAVIDGPSYGTHSHEQLVDIMKPRYPIPEEMRREYETFITKCEGNSEL